MRSLTSYRILPRLFLRFEKRKLLVASTIVAIRNFASSLDEYGAALKQFYFAVHPDFFEQHPMEKEINENSLKVLNHFMREVKSKQDVQPVTLKFFLRQDANSASIDHKTFQDNFASVQIRLKPKDLPTLVHDILSSCRLPIQEDLEQVVRKQQKKHGKKQESKIQWSSSLQDIMDEDIFYHNASTPADTLYTWLQKNSESARLGLKDMLPIIEENHRISKRIIRRHRLSNFVASNSGYSNTTLNGALRQMEFLFKRRNVNSRGLFGRTLKLGIFNGLDHLGRFIIDVTDVPTAWIQGINSINDLDGLVHVLDLTEMQISEALRGLQISRSRRNDPVPIKIYYKDVSRLLRSLRKSKEYNSLSSPVMSKYRARITSASDDLSIDDDGVIAVPCLTTSDAIFSFVRLNYPQIAEAKKTHARCLQQELHSIETCREALKLSSLRKDRIITADQMVQSCERLKREKSLGLESMKLVISNYYGISGDGEIRIPWQWKR